MAKFDPKSCDLDFTKGTIYKDLRKLGPNVYRDIKMSLSLGTSSDLIYYLKKHSKLLKGFSGNEIVEPIAKGTFSTVYLVKSKNGDDVVVKRSHDGWLPFQIARYTFIPIPRTLVKLLFHDYDISPRSLKRDVYDYEKIIRPFWTKRRAKLEGRIFKPYLNMALYMIDHFLPEFEAEDLYHKKFWKKLLGKKNHKDLSTLQKKLRRIETAEHLVPDEERYIVYDGFTNSLQTYFIQEAMIGNREVIPGLKMAYPFELVAAGEIPPQMPKLMIEHILRTIEAFVNQLDLKDEIPKVPDLRPIDAWKVFPPTPQEIYFAETGNLVAYYKNSSGLLNIALVDTHILHEPEGDIPYRWVEKRCWTSMFLNLRFWVKKALEL